MKELDVLVNEVVAGEKSLRCVLEEAHQLGKKVQSGLKEHPLSKLVGENVFMRSVTHHYTGKLISFGNDFLELVDAAWIADDGRFHTAMSTGEFSEVEPYPDGLSIYVPITSLNDIHKWGFPLPRGVK